MQVRTNIEYSFTANFVTYHVGDNVEVKTEFLDRCGEITEINFDSFEIAVYGDDERLIEIKYGDLTSIKMDNGL